MANVHWQQSQYTELEEITDQYYFSGSAWDTQVAKRFILSSKRVGKVVESSYYLHLTEQGIPYNVAFEPSISFGCPVGCLFCASGDLSPIKNLTAAEIADQVEHLIAIYRDDYPDSPAREDVFYCGIGEPTLMVDTLVDASHQILANHPHMQFKFSTMVAKPDKLIDWGKSDVPLRTVQIGIPHWDEEKVKWLYSKCIKYDLNRTYAAIKEFMQLKPDTRIKINYICINDFNDDVEAVKKTCERVVAELGKNVEFKLSCLNQTDFAEKNNISPTAPRQLEKLLAVAEQFGFTKAYLFGPISKKGLGCGQLAWNYQEGDKVEA